MNHPSIATDPQGQQSKQRCQGDTKVFPNQPRDIIFPAYPGSAPGDPASGTCPKPLIQAVLSKAGYRHGYIFHTDLTALSSYLGPAMHMVHHDTTNWLQIPFLLLFFVQPI